VARSERADSSPASVEALAVSTCADEWLTFSVGQGDQEAWWGLVDGIEIIN